VGDAASPLAAEGLPFVFDAFEQLGGFDSIEALIAGARWRDRAAARRLERPAGMAVVRFP
jgi:hypothetical protein